MRPSQRHCLAEKLKRVGLLLVVLAVGGAVLPPEAPAQPVMRWSDPATWPSRRVPTRSDTVVIPAGRSVLLDIPNAEARRLTVYGELRTPASGSVGLTMYGNLVVDGTGQVNFSGASWAVQFIVPSETQFVGGGDDVVDTDIGWWVMGAGRVDLQGDAKQPWTRLAGSAAAGATVITVQSAAGWRVGDEIAIVPTESPRVGSSLTDNYATHYDVVRITGIAGTRLTVSPALRYPHPAVTIMTSSGNRLYTAEVLNLTRTGRIEGRPGLRAHFFIRNTSRVVHNMRYVQFRWLGPLAGRPTGVAGRWGGPHFHRCFNNCFGSLVEGTVVRDFGAHAYIPHDSHGITFRGNIAHDGFETPFWYDGSMESPETGPNHTLLEGNVASKADRIPGSSGNRMAGFWIARGDNSAYRSTTNRAINNVAVGIMGGGGSAGYHWPEDSHGVWFFEGNLAHNNLINGIFVWQNDQRDHQVHDFVAYHNRVGIHHGAYANFYQYEDIAVHGNLRANLVINALSAACLPPCPERSLRFSRIYSESAGLHADAVQTGHHAAPGLPIVIADSRFSGFRRAAIALLSSGTVPDLVSVSRVTFVGNQYWVNRTVSALTLLVDNDQRICLRRYDRPGTFVPAWNARVTRAPC